MFPIVPGWNVTVSDKIIFNFYLDKQQRAVQINLCQRERYKVVVPVKFNQESRSMVAKKNSLLFIFAIHTFVLPQAQLILQQFTETSLLHYQQNMKNNCNKTPHYICKKQFYI